MVLYDALKDAIAVAKKADNIELYRQLLDLSEQAVSMQAEITRLKAENAELKKLQDISASIIQHKESFLTLKGEDQALRYCSHCWAANKILVQLTCDDESGVFNCPHCLMQGVYDKARNASTFRHLNHSGFGII